MKQNLSQQIQILNDRSGVVTYEQSVEIIEMFLVSIEHSLRYHALSYFSGNYKTDLKDRNAANIKASMDSEADKVISACRRQVAVFKLPSGETFKQFLDKLHPLNEGIVNETKQQGIHYFTEKQREDDSTQKLVDDYTEFVHAAINLAKKDIMAELEKKYLIQRKKTQAE